VSPWEEMGCSPASWPAAAQPGLQVDIFNGELRSRAGVPSRIRLSGHEPPAEGVQPDELCRLLVLWCRPCSDYRLEQVFKLAVDDHFGDCRIIGELDCGSYQMRNRGWLYHLVWRQRQIWRVAVPLRCHPTRTDCRCSDSFVPAICSGRMRQSHGGEFRRAICRHRFRRRGLQVVQSPLLTSLSIFSPPIRGHLRRISTLRLGRLRKKRAAHIWYIPNRPKHAI